MDTTLRPGDRVRAENVGYVRAAAGGHGYWLGNRMVSFDQVHRSNGNSVSTHPDILRDEPGHTWSVLESSLTKIADGPGSVEALKEMLQRGEMPGFAIGDRVTVSANAYYLEKDGARGPVHFDSEETVAEVVRVDHDSNVLVRRLTDEMVQTVAPECLQPVTVEQAEPLRAEDLQPGDRVLVPADAYTRFPDDRRGGVFFDGEEFEGEIIRADGGGFNVSVRRPSDGHAQYVAAECLRRVGATPPSEPETGEPTGLAFPGDLVRRRVMRDAKRHSWCSQAREALEDLDLNPNQRIELEVQVTVKVIADMAFCPWAETEDDVRSLLSGYRFGVYDGQLSFNTTYPDDEENHGYPVRQLHTSAITETSIVSVKHEEY